MTISFTEFLETLSGGSPFVILTVLLTLGVIQKKQKSGDVIAASPDFLLVLH